MGAEAPCVQRSATPMPQNYRFCPVMFAGAAIRVSGSPTLPAITLTGPHKEPERAERPLESPRMRLVLAARGSSARPSPTRKTRRKSGVASMFWPPGSVPFSFLPWVKTKALGSLVIRPPSLYGLPLVPPRDIPPDDKPHCTGQAGCPCGSCCRATRAAIGAGPLISR